MNAALEPAVLTSSRSLGELQAALNFCRIACSHSADTWLANSPLGSEALRCIRLLLDCADLCAAAEELLPFVEEVNPALLRSRLNTCVVACERCLRDVPRHRAAPLGHTVAACQDVRRACTEILPLLPSVAVVAA